MKGQLENFKIQRLWHQRDITLQFQNNRLIIVGENGSGKTTILRMLFETLACRWGDLLHEEFEEIRIKFSDINELVLSYADIEEARKLLLIKNDSIIDGLPYYVKSQIKEKYDLSSGEITFEQVKDIVEELGYDEYIEKMRKEQYSTFEDSKIAITERIIKTNFSYTIYYLPTYRRIERLGNRRNDREMTRRKNYMRLRQNNTPKEVIEIAKTGMEDVDYSIFECLEEIKRNADASATKLNYQCFKDILTRTSNSIEYNPTLLDDESIEAVFGSIDKNILSEKEVGQIKEILIKMRQDEPPTKNSYEQIIYYFYRMLLQRYQNIKNDEKKIIAFFNVCNNYLSNKMFDYFEGNYAYTITVLDDAIDRRREIDLEHLSSGEKQIVSMFCYLYLTARKKVFVLIDEPELSLSVQWQRKFLLDISNGDMCGGMVAVTHSPFVYDNELIVYAKSMNEFLI